MKINAELGNQAKKAKDAQELMDLCCANGLEMTQEAAERVMDTMRMRGEIAMDELLQCAGGGCLDPKKAPNCPKCGSSNTYAPFQPISCDFKCLDCGHKWWKE